MSAADSILRRVALVLSIVLVLLLASIAAISVFGADDTQDAAEGDVSPLDDTGTEDGDDVEDPASATALYPAGGVQLQTGGSDLAISCAPVIGNSAEYLVSAENLGSTSQTFLVAVALVDPDGDRVEALAQVDDLEPAEERTVPLELSGEVGSIEECIITAIEGDRQIILTGR